MSESNEYQNQSSPPAPPAPPTARPFFVHQFCTIKGKSDRVQIVSINGDSAKVAYNNKGEVAHKVVRLNDLYSIHPPHRIIETQENVFVIDTIIHPDFAKDNDATKNIKIFLKPKYDEQGVFVRFEKGRLPAKKLTDKI